MMEYPSQMLRPFVFVLAVGAMSSVPARAQTVGTLFLNRSVTVDGAEYRYQVYLPREYTASTSWPVILAWHGGGQYGRDGINQTDIGLAPAIRRHPDRFPAVVVFPQSPPGGTPGFQGLGERIALAALDLPVAVSRRMAAALKAIGADVQYTELPGIGHNA